MEWNNSVDGLYIYIRPGYMFTKKFALFDLDWTLVKPRFSKFPTSTEDNVIMENRIKKLKELKELVDSGYNIVIFTNQKVTPRESIDFKLLRMNDVIIKFFEQGIIVTVFMATKDNDFRKPKTGMWDLLYIIFKDVGLIIDKDDTFYCGDAAGRPGDFSDSDIKFAENVGIKFILPEDLFK